VRHMRLDGQSPWRAADGPVEFGPVMTLVSGQP